MENIKKRKLYLTIGAIVSLFIVVVSWLRLGIGFLLDNFFIFTFGILSWLFYLIVIATCVYLLFPKFKIKKMHIIAFLLALVSTYCMIGYFSDVAKGFEGMGNFFKATFQYFNTNDFPFLGVVGTLIFGIFSLLFDRLGTLILGICVMFIAIILVIYPSRHMILEFIKDKKREHQEKKEEKMLQQQEELVEIEETTELELPVVEEKPKDQFDEFFQSEVITNESSGSQKKEPKYTLPSINLLLDSRKEKKSNVNQKNATIKGKQIVELLQEFAIPTTLENISIGPSVTRFELKPESGVRIAKIASLQHDIKMRLAVKFLRVEAPIPGKNAVGIEIANEEKEKVLMKDVITQISPNEKGKLLFVLGKDLTGKPIYGNLNKMPHLLIAGATGSGKSVCVNSIITSILLRATPQEVKFVLIDPKKVEFTPYKNIPHLLTPIINNPLEASQALKVLVSIMDYRYDLFAKYGVRNINGYYQLKEKDLPKLYYIVVIIDELADLMMVASKEVEASIQRLTQLARAAGIHLILATQRPSVDVITGIIKANVPSRIAFAVSSLVDSRTILDTQGAEKLLGFGDMLYVPVGEQSPIRVQGVYVSDEEVVSICDHVAKYPGEGFDDRFTNETVSVGNASVDDVLYEEVKAFVIETQKASTSLLQRKFAIGYSRAAKLMDYLEENNVISPANKAKAREVLVKKEGD